MELKQTLGGPEELLDGRTTTAEMVRETARHVLGVSWWWNEEVKEGLRRKRLATKKWDSVRDEYSRQEYKEMSRKAKAEVAKAKEKAYGELYENLDTREGEKD